MEGHGRSRKVKEGQGRSWMVFSHHWIDISGEKSLGMDLGLTINNYNRVTTVNLVMGKDLP